MNSLFQKWINFYKDWYTFTDLRGWIKDNYDSTRRLWNDFKVKRKDIGKANFDLGLLHYKMGVLPDALFRFKLAKFFNKKYAFVDFFIGRCYLELYKLKDAKKYISQYLASSDRQYYDEAQYCLNIIENNSERINKIPILILKNNANQIAPVYNKIFISNRDYTPQQALFTLLSVVCNEAGKPFGNKILDIGQGTGVIGQLCKNIKLCSYLVGIDFAERMTEVAKELTVEGVRTYDELLTQNIEDYFATFNDETAKENKFDVVIAADFITQFADVELFANNCYKALRNGGMLALSYKLAKDQDKQFNTKLEEFYFSENFVSSIFEKAGFKLFKSEATTFQTKAEGRLAIYVRN